MATTSSVISSAAIKAGVVSTLTTAQSSEGLTALNDLLTFWGADDLNHAPSSESFSIGTSAAEYTIGSGGDMNTTRPMGINECFLRDSDGYDYPVEVMSSDKYNRLIDKDVSARPTQLYFLTEYPLAKIIFNSVPDAGYTAYFEFMDQFSTYATVSTTTTISLPPEYIEPLVYNLAVALCENWDRKVNPTVYEKALSGKDKISKLNASSRRVPLAKFDMGRGVRYNIENDMWGR